MRLVNFNKTEFKPSTGGQSELWVNPDHVICVYEDKAETTCILVTSGVIYTINLPIETVIDRLQ